MSCYNYHPVLKTKNYAPCLLLLLLSLGACQFRKQASESLIHIQKLDNACWTSEQRRQLLSPRAEDQMTELAAWLEKRHPLTLLALRRFDIDFRYFSGDDLPKTCRIPEENLLFSPGALQFYARIQNYLLRKLRTSEPLTSVIDRIEIFYTFESLSLVNTKNAEAQPFMNGHHRVIRYFVNPFEQKHQLAVEVINQQIFGRQLIGEGKI